jgi:hypothetical protein
MKIVDDGMKLFKSRHRKNGNTAKRHKGEKRMMEYVIRFIIGVLLFPPLPSWETCSVPKDLPVCSVPRLRSRWRRWA